MNYVKFISVWQWIKTGKSYGHTSYSCLMQDGGAVCYDTCFFWGDKVSTSVIKYYFDTCIERKWSSLCFKFHPCWLVDNILFSLIAWTKAWTLIVLDNCKCGIIIWLHLLAYGGGIPLTILASIFCVDCPKISCFCNGRTLFQRSKQAVGWLESFENKEWVSLNALQNGNWT